MLFALILLVSFVSAQENFNEYRDLDLIFYLGSNLSIVELSKNAKLDYVGVNVLLLPRNDSRLKINELETISQPEAEIRINDKATFFWEDINTSFLKFGIKARVNVNNDIIKIRNKIKFPIENDEFTEYTLHTDFIDVNEAIIEKTNELVEGETDLYFTVFKIADWVRNNVKYDLNTLTEKAVQKSTWVFENKQGVCDELTNLFISMLRSVGIPARFVSGTVYSNLVDNWGSHGWAEVYFPGYGWVPFDITFGEYGWVDASHLKLSNTADSGESSIEYNWRSRDIDLEIDNLILNTSLEKTGSKFRSFFELEVNTLDDNKFGFDSYILIEVKIKNLNEHYLSTNVFLTKAPELVGRNYKEVLLKPGETKSIYFISKLNSNLDENSEYSGSLEAKESFGSSASSNLLFRKDYNVFSLEEVKNKIDNLIKREEKVISKVLDLNCKTEKDVYYSDENIYIECKIRNNGNVLLKDVNVCLKSKCFLNDLRISEEKIYNFIVKNQKEIEIISETKDLIKRNNLKLRIIQVPDIFISGISPENVNYKDVVDLGLTLNSNFKAYNVSILVNDEFYYEFKDLEGSKELKINLKGKELAYGLEIKTFYYDEIGNKYVKDFNFKINVNNLPWYVRFIKFITFSE